MAQDPKVHDFLSEKRFAVLATLNRDGTPQLSVMWYELRGDTIMMNTARNRVKDKNLAHDQRISICVEDDYRWVSVSGHAQIVEDPATTQADIRALAIRYHGVEEGARMAEEVFGEQERVSIYLPMTKVVAREL